MKVLLPLGQCFFAVGLIAFGVQQFVFADFVVGRAPPWPENLPGRLVWAWLTGTIFVAAGVTIIVSREARWAGLIAAAPIFFWALLRHIPVALAAPAFSGEWTMFGKALVFTGGALTIAATFPKTNLKGTGAFDAFVNARNGFVYVGRWCLGLFMTLCGIQHFIHSVFVASLVPEWIPGPYFWTYFTGVALIAGGLGLLIPKTARLAALLSGFMVFAWVLMLHLPRAISALSADSSRNEWIAVFEALTVSGLAFVLAVTPIEAALPQSGPPPKTAS